MGKILVTGATSGIGKATVSALLEAGYDVVALGRDASKISDLSGNQHLSFHSIDLTTEVNRLEEVLADGLAGEGKYQGMVHCAGVEETTPLSLCDQDNIQRIYDINVFSGIQLLRVFSKKKFSENGSSVIMMSSVMGMLGQAGKVGYCSSKAAVLGIVKSAALELSRRQIRVNALLPGIVETPMTQELFASLSQENAEEIKRMHPLGIGKVEDVVPTILFLIGNGSKWITGQSLVLDGGYSIH